MCGLNNTQTNTNTQYEIERTKQTKYTRLNKSFKLFHPIGVTAQGEPFGYFAMWINFVCIYSIPVRLDFFITWLLFEEKNIMTFHHTSSVSRTHL